jgi:hypothetical protein
MKKGPRERARISVNVRGWTATGLDRASMLPASLSDELSRRSPFARVRERQIFNPLGWEEESEASAEEEHRHFFRPTKMRRQTSTRTKTQTKIASSEEITARLPS